MPKLIMVVDDWLSTRAYLGIILERHGFTVLRAVDGLAALDILQRTTPHLFILDLNLPGADGIELCKQIRSRPLTAQAPIIICSGRSDPWSRRQAFLARANAYLTKPIDDQEMLAKVDQLLGVGGQGTVAG